MIVDICQASETLVFEFIWVIWASMVVKAMLNL